MGVNLAPPGHPDQFAVVDHTPVSLELFTLGEPDDEGLVARAD